MTIIKIDEQFQPNRYLIISRLDEEDSTTTTNVIVTDQTQSKIQIINIEQGPVGNKGDKGDQGPAGRDGAIFDVLPIGSGGTNNTSYTDNKIIYYDGEKFSSSSYSVQDLLNQGSDTNAVTGVLAGTGLYKTEGSDSSTLTLDVLLGNGLEQGVNNEIVVDDTIARVSQLSIGNIQGTVPINKGGTNNTFFTQNRLVYFDGTQIKSFPIATGSFLLRGISVNIVAGSGLVGGGSLDIPDGSVVINIPSSADILVEDDLIQLSTTGTPGTYSKIITDDKGRVISGTSLTDDDIIEILGYTPFHPGNDGDGSGLDADLLDGQHGSYYINAENFTGILNPNILPSAVVPGTYTKFTVDSNGLISDTLYANQQDIIDSLGYTPVPNSGTKTIQGNTTLAGDVYIDGELDIADHLPLLALNNANILPDQPRGISFVYGGLFATKTGIIAYYPASDELKLVTNVFAQGADTDAGGNQDDLNGGNAESLFVLQNLNGDASTVLLRHIADSLYVKSNADETIAGEKVFIDNITFTKKISVTDPLGNTDPPFDISTNDRKVTNLNSDLLDDQHGSYYRNAVNITGAFSYENVTFDHIAGTNNYIPKFNDSVNDPANRIEDSIIYQDSSSNIVLDEDRNLIIGDADLTVSDRSISVGVNNKMNGENNLIVGTNNGVTGSNSIALNSNSVVDQDNSIALGNWGHAYLPQQMAFGVFNTQSSNTTIEHGQYTTISMHLPGSKPGNSWTSLSPTITIPDNKTFAYDLDLLITRAFGTGLAQYRFASGIFKNSTFRNSNNIVEVVNVTTQPQLCKKLEIFNNSQIKNHYHTFSHTNGQRQQQDVVVTESPIGSLGVSTENVSDNYFYTKEHKTISGSYYKTNNGDLILDIDKPLYSGNFDMFNSNRGIKILSRNHGVINQAEVSLSFSDAEYQMPDGLYKVYSIINKDVFFVERPFYTGIINYYSGVVEDYADIIINRNSIDIIDNISSTENFSSGLFDISDRIYVSTVEGNQFYDISSGNMIYDQLDYAGLDSISITGITLPKRTSYPSGRLVELIPLIDNSGSVNLRHKRNIDGDFNVARANFDKYTCFYTRYYDRINDNNQLVIYHTGLNRSMVFPHTPVEYSLVAGYLDNDNDAFEIVEQNDIYFLSAKNTLNYEDQNIYNIRIKAFDRTGENFLEKNITITVNDKTSPYSFIDIPNQVVDISDGFSYSVPTHLFFEEENEGPLTFSAQLQNGDPLPSWLSFDVNTATFSASPGGCLIGTYNIRLFIANNSSTIYRDFYLTVTDNEYQVFEHSLNDRSPITNIFLDRYSIDENLPSGSIISRLNINGSYNPYLVFRTAKNSFSGILSNNSDIVECLPDIRHYDTASVSGTVNLLELYKEIDGLYIPDNTTVQNIYRPFVMSGTPGLTDGNLYFARGYDDYNEIVFNGMKIGASGHVSLPRTFTVEGHNDYSVHVGERTVLTTELDLGLFADRYDLNTENSEDIVVKHSNLTSLWMSVEDMSLIPTGVVTEADKLKIIIVDPLSENVIWSSGYPNCEDSSLIENTAIHYTGYDITNLNVNTARHLDNINNSPDTELKRSNVLFDKDIWRFSHDIDNAVLAMYGIGSTHSGILQTEGLDLLITEDNDHIISDNYTDYGTRVVFNKPFEILDFHNVARNNGKLLADETTSLVTETGDSYILHDYAIAAVSGDVCLLFPGKTQARVEIIADYETDIDMSDTIYDFYYNWGKLIPFTFTNNKSYMRMSNKYTGIGRTVLITHEATLPNNDQYPVSGIKQYTYDTVSNFDCSLVSVSGNKGFESTHNISEGYYVTGLVDVYTTAGTGTITLTFDHDINLDQRDYNSIYLHNCSVDNTSVPLPVVGLYNNFSIINADTLTINNLFFLPDSGNELDSYQSAGTFSANLDKNHQYKEENPSIINRIPIEFLNTTKALQPTSESVNSRPKDYTFDINSIEGNKIYVRDAKNYLPKESNRFYYYDTDIDAEYITNGIAFSGSLFNNHKNIYDIRYSLYRFDEIYKQINFEYSHSSKIFSFIMDSGIIQPFDNLIVQFPSGYAYDSDDIYAIMHETNIQINTGLLDLEPYKDSILLETSSSVPSTELYEQIKFTGTMTVGRDAAGTCTVNNNLTNRLQSGMLINHTNSNIYGYQIDSIVDGFSFSGVIPQNNNVISTNIVDLLDNNHVGHAAIFGTGSNSLYSGARILRQAIGTDIGYAEYYLIDTNSTLSFSQSTQDEWSSPVVASVPLTPTGLFGVGSANSKYQHKADVRSNSQNTKIYLEFLYLGQNTNQFNIEGVYIGSGDGTSLKIYQTSLADQVDKYRQSFASIDPIESLYSQIFELNQTTPTTEQLYKDTDFIKTGGDAAFTTNIGSTGVRIEAVPLKYRSRWSYELKDSLDDLVAGPFGQNISYIPIDANTQYTLNYSTNSHGTRFIATEPHAPTYKEWFKSVNITRDIQRFDIIRIEIEATGIDTFAQFDFATYILSDIDIKPYILESETIINDSLDYLPYIDPEKPSLIYTPVQTEDAFGCSDCNTRDSQFILSEEKNGALLTHDFYILPYIKTNNFYCGDEYNKNESIFYNGNIINIHHLETPKSYLEYADEILIRRLNNTSLADSGVSRHIQKYNSSNDILIISGISIEGQKDIPPRDGLFAYDLMQENEYRYNMPFGVSHNDPLPKRGTINFIKAQSGHLNVLNYNNIYYHQYGGTTSHYPLDIDGKFVQPPQTGIYHVHKDFSLCESGTLCVIISGYNVSSFTGVEPNKHMFFDFVDGAQELTKSYPIKDLMQVNALSISPDFDERQLGKSGLVYIIDSKQNIKSNLNPNLDNNFITLNASSDGFGTTTKNIDYYDYSTKRWKHTVHLGDQPDYGGYSATLSSTKTDFYSINSVPIQISGISYLFDDNTVFEPLGSSLTIPDNVSEISLKITTLEGDQNLLEPIRQSIPKMSVSGIGGYYIVFNEPANYGWHGSGWVIGAKLIAPKEYYTDRDIIIRVSDLTGHDDWPLSISQRQIPSVKSFYPTGYVGSGNMWKLGFDISKLHVAGGLANGDLYINISNVPDPNNYKRIYADAGSIVFSGDTRGAEIGIYDIELLVRDISTTPYYDLAIATGTIEILDHISSQPTYQLPVNNLEPTEYINLVDQENLEFYIPALLGSTANEVTDSLSITFNTDPSYDFLLYSSNYNTDSNRFEIVARPMTTGSNLTYLDQTGKFINQSVTISLKQPIYDTFGNISYQTYTDNIPFNLTFYQPIEFEPIPQQKQINFNTDEPWSMEFYIKSGICEHDRYSRPNATIFNAPNLGTYDSTYPEYTIEYEYDDVYKKWKVTFVSKQDAFRRFIPQTGVYSFDIFAEDAFSSSIQNHEYSIKYNPIKLMDNIPSDVYATPDNEFYTKADSLDQEETSSDDISFPFALKESSISLPNNNLVRLYDRDLSLWQYGYTSSKMTDRYDAKIDIDGNTISVSCKGIGDDKIMAVAKMHTIEISSTELEGIPLKITGISNYSPGGSIDVNQGDKGWELKFNTIGGLAHPNFPPTIILENMPTFCTGFNPLIETQLQCLVSAPKWDPNLLGEGGWSYHFSGLPSCTLLGLKEFNITAIDTNPTTPDSMYYGTDSVDFAFTYKEGNFAGSPPQISGNPQYAGMDIMKPYCNTYYTKQLNFGPGDTALCIGPTGLKTISVEGSVPPGLSYTLFYPEFGGLPVAPYSNLAEGYLKIEGYPTTFADGGAYDETLTLTVTDARGLEASETVTFSDASSPNDPDVGIVVYFDRSTPTLTPKTGLKPIESSSQAGWRPPPIEQSLSCNSILPHNLCGVSTILFSGLEEANNLNIYLQNKEVTPTNNHINANDEIYIAFDSYNSQNDGGYLVLEDEIGMYINGAVSLQNPSQVVPITGDARVVIAEYVNDIKKDDFDKLFEGNIIESTSKCILGGGLIDFDRSSSNSTKRGIRGLIMPTHKASLTGSSPFEESDSKLDNLRLDRINNDIDVVSTTSWSDCWQTGHLYVSGIVLPSIYAEIRDPPPAQDYYFSFNGTRFALGTRLAYGATETERQLPENERSASLKYVLTDLFDGTTIDSGSVAAGSSFDTSTLIKSSGTVYSIKIYNTADTFPTFDHTAIPASENEYVWTHKGANLTAIPSQNTFPPLISVGFDSISAINSLTDSDPNGVVMEDVYGILVGGYIPTDAGVGDLEPYSQVGGVDWSVEDYIPIVSGIIQQKIFDTGIVQHAASYNGETTLLITQGLSLSVGDAIAWEFYTVSQQGDRATQYSNKQILTSNELSGGNLSISIDLGADNINGYVDIVFKGVIDSIDTVNNELILVDNFDYTIGDSIGIDLNRMVSTELNILADNGHISIASGADGLVYLENTNSSSDAWLAGFAAGDFVDLYMNIDDNIKIMPYNIEFINEGKYSFVITGRSNILAGADYIFKVAAMDNPDMPVFDAVAYPDVNITPKKYFTNYPLHISKPIEILTNTVSKNGNTLTFSIDGGKRPIYENTPDIQLAAGINGDYGYCGFWRNSIGTGNYIVDQYDTVNDRLNINIDLDAKYGIDWSVHNAIKIRVSDETGTDTYTYTF